MNHTHLVSIIVPVYNVELYLEKCIESILSQTYKHIEVILINDGSTDSSKEICDLYAQRDNRIILINKSNGGVSETRNLGINKAKGKYIMFIDSDDWIDSDCIEKCIIEFKKDSSIDIVLFPYLKEYKEKKIKVNLFSNEERYFNQEETRNILLKKLFGPVKPINPLTIDNMSAPWGKLYRKTTVEDIRFIDMKIIGVEDSYYNIQAFYNAKACKYVLNTFYHYRKTNSGSLTNNYNLEKAYLRENMYAIKKEFIRDNYLDEQFEDALNNRVIVNLFSMLYGFTCSNIGYKTKIEYCQQLLTRQIYKEAFKEFDLNAVEYKWRLFYWLCKHQKYRLIIVTLNIIILIKMRGLYSEK